MKKLGEFSKLYPVSKTLRFELIPIGKTAETIAKNGIIANDTDLASSYKKMKKTIDRFHKSFIDSCMENVRLSSLQEYYALYTASSEEKSAVDYKKHFDTVKQALRKEVVSAFRSDAHKQTFDILNKKELIQKYLREWIDANEPDLYFDGRFHNFTTYFTGYNENRMNMYSDEEKATAVAYRLINENLPKFIDNIFVFKKIESSDVSGCFSQVAKDMQAYINYNSLADMFALSAYSNTLTQASIDAYNTVIGGIKEGDKKYQGLNEYINLYNQTHPQAKLPKFKPLFKQILSDRISASWLPESFGNVDDMLEAIQHFCSDAAKKDLFNSILSAAANASDSKPDGIFVCNDSSISTISNGLFGYYGLIRESLDYYYTHVIVPDYSEKLASAKNEKAVEKLEKAKRSFTGAKYHSIATLEAALKCYLATFDLAEHPEYQKGLSSNCIADWFADRKDELLNNIAAATDILIPICNANHNDDYKLTSSDKATVKAFLDTIMELLHYVKPLYVKPGADVEKDALFYGTFDPLYEELQHVTNLYDMVRNFCTKKPFSTEKIKLNFNCSTLLDGWDLNKEDANLGVLFERNGQYYLGIMDKASNRIFQDVKECSEADCYRKMEYKLLPGPNKMLPKVFFSKSRIDEFAPSKEVLDIYQKGTFKKGPNFNLDDCHKLIDFFKASIEKHPDWKKFGFKFSATNSYEDISAFYREISAQGYKVTFKNISSSYIDELVNDGKLYLFQIYNKDFSPYAKGKPNLHTMYWKALFEQQNLDDVVYKLNGQAEIFFRKKSIAPQDTVVHKANQPIAAKNPLLNGKATCFTYDLIKDRRYTVDKFQFHVPITMNFKSVGSIKINESVCAYLKNNPDVNIIGIDRGERHLLYISMIDRFGNVVKGKDGKYIQYSLNTITGSYKDASGNDVRFETPYHTLLDTREQEREKAREDWGTIENIKELKSGYLSQVVHHICKLMVEYNAIVVLEDLNGGFKNSRKKVEKQVYQNFEKALIQKLNYLIFKENNPAEAGGLYHAYQLTDAFQGFKYLTKQTGFLFYVPAWNTSKIDPITGFTDLLKPKYKSVKESQSFFSRFDRISYNPALQHFEFAFDYNNFTEKATGTRTEWVVCTHGELRYAFNRKLNSNRGGYEKIDVTAKLRALFAEYNIDYSAENLVDDIVAQTSPAFFARLIKLLQVTLAMRYSCTEDDKDFILSPVMDDNGKFFNTEVVKSLGLPLPQDADANGAYNIARKGLMVLQQIDRAEKYKDWSTKISNKDWLSFVQGGNGR